MKSRFYIINQLLCFLLLFGYSTKHDAQISIPNAAFTDTQDFNSLASTGTSSTLPAGWAFAESGANANAVYTAGTGGTNAGDTYSFGLAANTDRALGGLQSGSLIPTIGVCYTNNTGGVITSFTVTYTGETWRVGTASRTDGIQFQYNQNTTGITGAGTWTSFGALDYFNPGQAATGSGALQHSALITSTITGLSIQPGTTFCFRWNDFNATGSDDGIGVDDYSLTSLVVVPINDLCANATPIVANGGNICGTTIGAGADNPIDGDPCGTSADALGAGVWYTFTGDGQTWDFLFPEAVDWDPEVNVYSGTCAALVCEGGDDDSGSGLDAQFSIPTITGTTYYVYVHPADDFGNRTSDFCFTVETPLACALTAAGLTEVACDDNGTPTIATDDIIEFRLNPVGTDTGAGYTVTAGATTVGTGMYGEANGFALPAGSAGAGNVTLTITDNGNPACSIVVVVTDPGVCSTDPCSPDGTAPTATSPLAAINVACPADVPTPDTDLVTDAADACPACVELVWINEFHYDNDGTDTGEFIEVVGTAGTDLSAYSIVLYNGANGQTYGDMPLSGVLTNQSNGFGTAIKNYASNGIQNGAPDGIALVKGATVIQFISYEGVMTATNGPATGMTSTDVGVLQPSNNPADMSLQLIGSGNKPSDFTWAGPSTDSRDAFNAGQTMTPCSNTLVTFVSDVPNGGAGSTASPLVITRTYQVEDAAGNTTNVTQTINVVDNVFPTAVCQAATVAIGAGGTATVTAAAINNNSTDNCGTVTLSAAPTSFTCANVGANPVLLTVTDNVGLTDTCTAIVTVTVSPVTVVFPALSPACSPVAIVGGATPAGGVYSGTGITDNGDGTFNVNLALVPIGTTVAVTYTVTSAQSCTFSATSNLLMLACNIGITDPCSCNDDKEMTYDAATDTYAVTVAGTFDETVTVSAGPGILLPTGLDIRVTAVTGAIGVAVGDALVFNAGVYEIPFTHQDNVGYSMTVDFFNTAGAPINQGLSIRNKCAYPNPTFNPELDAIYCNFEDAITLGALPTGADLVTFTVNGAAATTFNPTALGEGTYDVVMTYDGAAGANATQSPDAGNLALTLAQITPAVPGCTVELATSVIVRPLEASCVSNLNVTLGDNCTATITPAMVLRGEYTCADNIVVTINGQATNVVSGCGNHEYMVEIFVAGESVYTCWGNINAEDKTPATLVCPAPTSSITRSYASQTVSGTLTAGDPELNLNNYSCFNDVALDGNHDYDLVTFTTTGSDIYTLLLETDFADGNMVLFQGAFNAANPCENIVGSEDDAFVPGTNGFDPALRLSLPLQANTTYTVMVTNWNPADFGDWTLSIFTDNGTQVTGGGFAANSAVETRDLICNDIEAVRFFGQPRYVVNANGTVNRDLSAALFPGATLQARMAALDAFLAKLDLTRRPTVTDNCGPVLVTLSDAVVSAGDCGNVTLTRTFTATDRYQSCANTTAPLVTRTCTQAITFRKPTIADLVFPPFTAPIECDENFAVDENGNPHPSVTGYPWLRTATGFYNLSQSYCNVGASYSDEPRIVVCEGTYKFRREWNIIDWCNPGGSGTIQQLVKVGDFTGPTVTGVPTATVTTSTSPFACTANYRLPALTVTDLCSATGAGATTYRVETAAGAFVATGNITSNTTVSGLAIGTYNVTLCAADGCGNETCSTYVLIVRDEIEPTASCDDELNVSIGGGDVANGVQGIARITADDVDEGSNDNCGPVTLEVRRQILDPNNYACLAQFDYDGDGVVINDEVRRDANDFAAPNGWFTPWLAFVDFTCCDVDADIMVELRVTDQSGNVNVCWKNVAPEDKINPTCFAPANVTLTCAALPLTFPGNLAHAYDIAGSGDTEPGTFVATSIMMDALFGAASGTDNCAVDTVVERTPTLNVNDCGWGSITRRFEAWQWRPAGDVNGNGRIDRAEAFVSLNSCAQTITITELHDFVIDFPQDAEADCGEACIWDVTTVNTGCDVFSINRDTVRFSATGDECYKLAITYDVINWCLWDGEYEGYVIPRLTEDDGEALPVDRSVESTERPIIRISGGAGATVTGMLHRDHDNTPSDVTSIRRRCPEGTTSAFVAGDDSGLQPTGLNAGNGGTRGRWIYTQFVKVYDTTAPEISVGEYGGPTALCPDLEAGEFGDVTGACTAPVTIPFNVTDPCELFNGNGDQVVVLLSANLHAFAVDANRDGIIKANEFTPGASILGNITGNATDGYTFSGTYPIITSAMGDNIYHAIRVVFRDGCGNTSSRIIEFKVLDCKGPAPVCINSLTVTLMPQLEGGCAMAIWASDFEGSFISDCTGQGPETFLGLPRVTRYAIYRTATAQAPGFVPNPNDTGLVLTDEDDDTVPVRIYAFDNEGNYDYCETFVIVQQHGNCAPTGGGTLSGVITTEGGQTVQGVEVNVNATTNMVTGVNGQFSFTLPTGGDYSVTPYLNANPLNGVSTFDLVLMSKHILGVQLLDSPYKRIAADVNRSNTITTLDMIQLRKLILNIETTFTNNTSWRFVDAAFAFPDATNPWATVFPELISVNDLPAQQPGVNFIAVKIGDVNGNAQANALAGDDRTLNGQFNFNVANTSVKAGNVYTVAFTGADMASVEGFQATLALNGAELVDIEYGVATAENFGIRFAGEGMITTSWNGKATANDVLFSLVIRATVDAELSDVIGVSSRYTAAEAYANGNTMNVGVNFSNGVVAAAGFEVYQNTPNPFAAETMIGFNLPQDAAARVTVSDASGRVLTTVRGDYAAGYNTVKLTKEMIQGATGVLTYTVTAGEFTATKKMVAVK